MLTDFSWNKQVHAELLISFIISSRVKSGTFVNANFSSLWWDTMAVFFALIWTTSAKGHSLDLAIGYVWFVVINVVVAKCSRLDINPLRDCGRYVC